MKNPIGSCRGPFVFLSCYLSAFVLLTVLAATAIGQQETPVLDAKPPGADTLAVTAEEIQARIKRIEETKEMDETVKKKTLDLYNEALTQLKVADDWATRRTEYEKSKLTAPQTLADIKEKLTQVPPETRLEIPPDSTLAQLEQALALAESELVNAKAEVDGLTAERSRRDDRRREVPKLIAGAKQQIEEIDRQLSSPPDGKDAPQVTEAKRMLLLIRRRAAENEFAAHTEEILSYDARGELSVARRDLATRKLAETEKRVKIWQDVVNARRAKEAERLAREAAEARKAAQTEHPLIRQLARDNEQLAALRTGSAGLPAKIEKATSDVAEMNTILKALQEGRKIVQEKVKAAGLTKAMSALLRKEREHLPDPRKYRRTFQTREQEISAIQVQMLEHEDVREDLADLSDEIEEITAQLDPATSENERKQIEQSAREFLQKRSSLLETLIKEEDLYFTKLIDLNTAARQIIDETDAYIAYVDEQILWFRSTSVLDLTEARTTWAALRWLARPANWSGVVEALRNDFSLEPLPYCIVFLSVLVLLILRRPLRLRIQATAGLLPKSETDKFAYTIRVLILTILRAVLWPGVLWFAGWRLTGASHASDFGKCIGASLGEISLLYFALELLRHTCLKQGLAETHFRWPDQVLVWLRDNLPWLMAIALPTAFVQALFASSENDVWSDSLGRIAFIIGMVAVAIFMFRLLRSTRTLMQEYTRRRRGGWIVRFRLLWFFLVVGLPIAFAAASIVGYHYTAHQLERRLMSSVALVLGLLLFNEIVSRWIFVLRRRLALRKAQRRRETDPATRKKEGEINLHNMSVQAQKVVRTVAVLALLLGLWFIWANVLPALGILNRVELWTTLTDVTREVKRPDGTVSTETVEQIVPITLGHIGMAFFILAVTLIAAKNVPGLMEMTIVQRIPMDAGVLYAISAVSRYTLTVVGIAIAFDEIGIGWAKVQWLIAAMTVGLGFGLQEIFANFVSGLIIFFERPMRIGDVVTVGEITGTVTNIRIRATTITDWDRKELIVPNREFVTGQLINWTLSDSILRVILKVGVAYGTDTDLATRILLDVAKANPSVLNEPPPSVIFCEFGDSTYNFELRVFVPDVNAFFTIRHDLNTAIKKAFERENIEIAFPQQDIHIRSVEQAFPIADARERNPHAPPRKKG
ncbi:MAG: mechanosensitive ion channel domain-containing protein [Planctomycetota bacterium]